MFGHLNHDKSSFSHYIQRDKFYENNKQEILLFFLQSLTPIFKKIQSGQKVLIVTPKFSRSSSFIQDLLQTELFADKHTVILTTDHRTDYPENFRVAIEKNKPYYKILFFDYMVSGGNTYWAVTDNLRVVNQGKGFDALLFLLDRTTKSAKEEILRTLYDDERRFFAFFKLNVPLLTITKNKNPITEKLSILNNLINDCHLDALKTFVADVIAHNSPKNLEELEGKYREKPVEERQRHLLKLHISHEISFWFYRQRKIIPSHSSLKITGFNLEQLKYLIGELKRNRERFFSNAAVSREIIQSQQEQITDIAVKILSRPPYKYYHGIYQAVFELVSEKLQEVSKQLHPQMTEPEKRRFKFYIKRSVELNSNFLLWKHFFERLKQVFSEGASPELLSTKCFLLKSYKELIFKNPSRSIKLEALFEMVPPRPLCEPDMPVAEAMRDPFYQLGRIIKAENVYLLNELKAFFISQMQREELVKEKIQELAASAQSLSVDDAKRQTTELKVLLKQSAPFFREDLNNLKKLFTSSDELSLEEILLSFSAISQLKDEETDLNKLKQYIAAVFLDENQIVEPRIRLAIAFLKISLGYPNNQTLETVSAMLAA